jgi:predicted metalloendopeptidase
MKNKTEKNNFYLYVNDEWIKRKKSKSRSRKEDTDSFSLLIKKTDSLFLRDYPFRGKANELLVAFHRVTDVEVKRHFDGGLEIMNGSFESLFSFFELNDVPFPLTFVSDINPLDPTRYILFLVDGDGCFINERDFYDKEKEKKRKRKLFPLYLSFLKSLFAYFFPNTLFDVEKVLEKEIWLMNHSMLEKEREKETHFHKYRLDTLDALGFSVKCDGEDKKREVIVDDVSLVKDFMVDIKKNLESWRIYFIFQWIRVHIKYVPELLKKLHTFLNVFLITDRLKTYRERSLIFVKRVCNDYISDLYLRDFEWDVEKQKRLVALFHRIIMSYIRRVRLNEMDVKIKDLLFSKLRTIDLVTPFGRKMVFPFSTDGLDFRDMDMFSITKQVFQEEYRRKWNRKYVSKEKVWSSEYGNIYTVNAFYRQTRNEIVIPYGILRKPFYDSMDGLESWIFKYIYF